MFPGKYMSKKIEIKELNIGQTIAVYNKSLKKDFPANEHRPLALIVKGMIAGTYECLGAFYKDNIKVYRWLFTTSK